MGSNILGDQKRFTKKMQDLLRNNLDHLVQRDKLVFDKDGKTITIPLPRIHNPQFIFDYNQRNGVAQGEGDEGDPLDGNPTRSSDGMGKSGDDETQVTKVQMPVMEAIDILIEKLELPFLKPEGKNIEEVVRKYTSIHREGPRSLIHKPRTLKRAILRNVAGGTYTPGSLSIQKEDFVYKAPKDTVKPHMDAVLIYLMDCSSSMEEMEREMVRNEIFLIDLIMERLYQIQKGKNAVGLKTRYVIHATEVHEVGNQQEFLETYMQGGTLVAPAMEYVKGEIQKLAANGQKNIYLLHYSDSGPFSEGDLRDTMGHLHEIMPLVNMYAFTDVLNFGHVSSRRRKDPKSDLYNEIEMEFFGETLEGKVIMCALDKYSPKETLRSIRTKFKPDGE